MESDKYYCFIPFFRHQYQFFAVAGICHSNSMIWLHIANYRAPSQRVELKHLIEHDLCYIEFMPAQVFLTAIIEYIYTYIFFQCIISAEVQAYIRTYGRQLILCCHCELKI